LKHDKPTADIQETAALYALGSLSLHEARTFESHVQEGCPVCEIELRRFERTVAGIGLGAAEIEPPEYLRDLLSARVERDVRTNPPPPLPSEEKGAEPKKAAKAETEPTKAPPMVPPPVFRTAVPARERSFLSWAIAAVCTLAAVLTYFAWKQSENATIQQSKELKLEQKDSAELRTLLDIQKGKNQELDQINAVLASPGSRSFSIAGQPPASLIVLWNTQKNQWLLTGYLSAAPEGKIYQIWLVTWAGKINAGSVKTDRLGRVFATINLPAGLAKITASEITLESQEGSKQPTLPAIATGKIN
jgi:anti-sigma-K factor RskA